MTPRAAGGVALLLAAACGRAAETKAPTTDHAVESLPPELRDATLLGREVFQLVDRAVDYKGSHSGRPPQSLRQMGIDSLAPFVVRRITTVSDSTVATVAFRQPRGRTVASCEGNAQILEEASLGGGKFSLVCATASGIIKRYQMAVP